MGLAGYYLYSKWDADSQVWTNLSSDYEKLHRLNSAPILPGTGPSNNITLAKQEQDQLRGLIQKCRAFAQRVPPIPDLPKVTDQDFFQALGHNISQLQKDATNASVVLPPDYSFSFEAERRKIVFAAGSVAPLSAQLGEVKAICEVLFAAKVNTLDSIRRERVSSDDATGPQTDFLTDKSITNELAVLTPYELSFQCFSAELAAVLSGFASSPNGMVVKSVNVEAAPAAAAATGPTTVTPTMIYQQPPPMANDAERAYRSRYGLPSGGDRYGGGGIPGGVQYRPLAPGQPAYTPPAPAAAQPTTAPTGRGGLPTILDERQLKVTLNLVLVKLLPPK
jgi:hypothetical protein